MKIAIIVHGRIFAFDLARELVRKGHEVTLFTNYPKRIVEKFGVPRANVKSFLIHGLVSRVFSRVGIASLQPVEAFLHSWFGRWAAKQLKKEEWDVLHIYSGVAEECFDSAAGKPCVKTLMRASSHIRTQHEILTGIEKKRSIRIEKPSAWRIEREEKEYRMADVVYVLSSFCENTFLENGYPRDKLRLWLQGVDVQAFTPNLEVRKARNERVRGGAPLRVLMVGAFSSRKGAFDLMEIADQAGKDFKFRFVGSIASDMKKYKNESRSIEFVPKVPQLELPREYEWGDIFIFPTIEDGFPAVLAQAQAAGLPVLTTPNASGPDIIRNGENGWVLPAQSPKDFLHRLQWCSQNRDAYSKIMDDTGFSSRDWSQVAEEFIRGFEPQKSSL